MVLTHFWNQHSSVILKSFQYTQPTCDYSKINFTVLCVAYNFTVRHEIKTGCARGLP